MNFDHLEIVLFFREISIHVLVWSTFSILFIFEQLFPAIKTKKVITRERLLPNFLPMILIYFWIPVIGYIPLFISNFTHEHNIGILNFFNIKSFTVHLLVVFFIRSFGSYLHHRINHNCSHLWRFHSVHHADKVMDVTTTWRINLVEISINILLICPYLLLTGASIHLFIVYDTLSIVWNLWSHANISIPKNIRSYIELFFFTPDGHRVHHSSSTTISRKNYGSITNLWDKLFGTYSPGLDDLTHFRAGIISKSSTNQQNKLWSVLIKGYTSKDLNQDRKQKKRGKNGTRE